MSQLVTKRIKILDQVGIEDCEASVQEAVIFSLGTVHAERVRVVRPRVIRHTLNLHGTSSWTDCIFSDFVDRGATNKMCFNIPSGTHTFTRTTILRSGWALSMSANTITTMLDSRIADCRGCVWAEGMVSLRNTKLSNCSN